MGGKRKASPDADFHLTNEPRPTEGVASVEEAIAFIDATRDHPGLKQHQMSVVVPGEQSSPKLAFEALKWRMRYARKYIASPDPPAFRYTIPASGGRSEESILMGLYPVVWQVNPEERSRLTVVCRVNPTSVLPWLVLMKFWVPSIPSLMLVAVDFERHS
jgi:hypothetical protein